MVGIFLDTWVLSYFRHHPPILQERASSTGHSGKLALALLEIKPNLQTNKLPIAGDT